MGMKIARIAARKRAATGQQDIIAPLHRVNSRTLKNGERISDAERNYWRGVCRNDEFGNGLGKCMNSLYRTERVRIAEQHYSYRGCRECRSYGQRKDYKS